MNCSKFLKSLVLQDFFSLISHKSFASRTQLVFRTFMASSSSTGDSFCPFLRSVSTASVWSSDTTNTSSLLDIGKRRNLGRLNLTIYL